MTSKEFTEAQRLQAGPMAKDNPFARPAPTPEQIEAAARAIFENMSDIDGDEADWIHFRDDCMEGAKAALTAAAEVGERKKMDWAKRHEIELIERCAEVADQFALVAQSRVLLPGHASVREAIEEVAAAIRALKDKP